MTLLIALIANDLHAKLVGDQYVTSFAIFCVWVLHLLYHSGSKSKSED